MKHISYKQTGKSIFNSTKSLKVGGLIPVENTDFGEIVTIGKNKFKAVFIKSPDLSWESGLGVIMNRLPGCENGRLIQYCPSLGGFLFAHISY